MATGRAATMLTDKKVRSIRKCKTGIRVQARGIIAGLDASRSAPVLTMSGTGLFVGPAQQPRYHVCAPALLYGRGADALPALPVRRPSPAGRFVGRKARPPEGARPAASTGWTVRRNDPAAARRPLVGRDAGREHRKGRYGVRLVRSSVARRCTVICQCQETAGVGPDVIA